jgi:DNA-binding transcriptional LysR family regulator
MEFRQLKYFLSVVEEGSVSAAAAVHFVTQPAVSAQLKRLEEEAGEPLFERRGRRLVLTQVGRLLVTHAEDVVRRMDELERSLQGLRSLDSGRLRMGTIDAASVYVLPDVYRAFHRKYPGVRIEVVVDDTSHLVDALLGGDIELAITTLPVGRDGVEAQSFYREQMIPVAHPSHPLASKRRVSLAELSEQGVISYPDGSTTRRLIEAVFAEHGIAYRAIMELSSPEAMKRLAQAELGVSILPRPVVSAEIGRRSLKALAMGRVRFEREIGMVFRRRESLSPPARAFLEMVDARTARRQRESRRA